jgi:threonine aldolase
MGASERGGITFGSDNYSGAHPEVLRAIEAANVGHATAYEADPWSAAAHALLKRHFGAGSESFFVFNGTGANTVALATMAAPHQVVFCSEVAHVHVDECGAPPKFGGYKLVPLAGRDGKIAPADIRPHLSRRGDQHASQPRVVTITQPTELGTVYGFEELAALAAFARDEGLLLHMDGSRLVNAAARLGCPLARLTAEAGIDVLSFGGTKHGLLFGEAVVFFRPELAKDFKYVRKQGAQLPSKARFVAAQFTAWLEGDLWLRSARHANAMADRLRAGLARLPYVTLSRPTEANGVFARLPESVIAPLQEKAFFYVWDDRTFEVRLMATWDTKPEDVDAFVAALEGIARAQKLA